MNRKFIGWCRMLFRGMVCLVLFPVLVSACGGSKTPPLSKKHMEEVDQARRARDAFEAGRSEEALALYRAALKTSRSVEDKEAIAVHLINVSVVLRELGRVDEAMIGLDEILARDPIRYDDRWFSSAALVKAALLQDLGRPSEASSWADRALASCQAAGCDDLGRVYNRMARIAMQRGDAGRASALASSGLEASRKQGDRGEVANAYRLMADLRMEAGAPAEALVLFEKALSLDKELGRSRKIALDLMGLGSVHEGLGQDTEALRYFRRALSVARALEDKGLAETVAVQMRRIEAK